MPYTKSEAEISQKMIDGLAKRIEHLCGQTASHYKLFFKACGVKSDSDLEHFIEKEAQVGGKAQENSALLESAIMKLSDLIMFVEGLKKITNHVEKDESIKNAFDSFQRTKSGLTNGMLDFLPLDKFAEEDKS